MTRPTINQYRLNDKEHPLYAVHRSMYSRCYTPTDISFNRYGGRGVTMCQEWLDSKDVFVKWGIDNGWDFGLQIDKDILSKELNINPPIYSPQTCMFVSRRKNVHNSRSIKKTDQEIADIILLFDSKEDTFQHRQDICYVFNITKKQLGCYLARRGNKKLGRGKSGVLTKKQKLKIIELRVLGVTYPKIGEYLNLNWSSCRTFYTKYQKGLISV
jgi:hypothetical protein